MGRFSFMAASHSKTCDLVLDREPVPLVEHWRYKRARDLLMLEPSSGSLDVSKLEIET